MATLKLGKLAGALGLVLLSAYEGMFILDPMNIWVFVYLKAVAVAVIPGLICFSWLLFWGSCYLHFSGFMKVICYAVVD